jgi:hypothetical protein
MVWGRDERRHRIVSWQLCRTMHVIGRFKLDHELKIFFLKLWKVA